MAGLPARRRSRRPLARRRCARDVGDAGAGGFFDITAGFTIDGATVVGVGIGSDGPLWPFLLVLLSYYVSGTTFLAFSSIGERAGRTRDDGRSLSFLRGIANGAETIAVHTLWLVAPSWPPQIAVVWAAVVGLGTAQRIVAGHRAVR